MIKNLFKKATYPLACIISVCGLVIFMISTNPSETNFMISFIPLILVWVIIFTLSVILMRLLKFISVSLTKIVAVTLASTTTLLIMFSALGDLAFFDIALILALATIGVFYFLRSWQK